MAEAGILSVRPCSNISLSPFGLSYYLTQVCPTCPNPITFNLTEATLVPNLNAGTAMNSLTVVHPAGTINFVEITDRLVTTYFWQILLYGKDTYDF